MATPLHLPAARFIGGWAPGGSSDLILTTGWQFQVGGPDGGPYEIDVATVQANGQATSTLLTKDAMTFPFVGFVRTA